MLRRERGASKQQEQQIHYVKRKKITNSDIYRRHERVLTAYI